MPLTSAELSVMQLLWRTPGLTARQILEALYPKARKSQHGTVQKLLERLEEKGFVTRDRTQPVQRVAPRVSQAAYLGDEMESLADQLTGGALVPMITALIHEKKLTAAELRQLRKLVEEL
jgi:BlaI family transcriptional regulator, penicillinase repressor